MKYLSEGHSPRCLCGKCVDKTKIDEEWNLRETKMVIVGKCWSCKREIGSKEEYVIVGKTTVVHIGECEKNWRRVNGHK